MYKKSKRYNMDKLSPKIIEQTILQSSFAKSYYKNFLLPKIKKHPSPLSEEVLRNILAINTATGRGGAAKVAHDFLNKNLNKKGYSSKILVNKAFGEKDNSIIELEQNNPKLHKLLHKVSRSLGWLDFFNPACFEIPKLQEFQKADIVHLHNLHGAYFSPFILPELTSLKPTIWTLHDEQAYTGHCSYSFKCNKWMTGCGNCPDLNYYPKLKKDTTNFLINTKKEIYDSSHLTIVVPSNWLAERAKKSILSNKEVKVIYNGIDEKIFSPTKKNIARNILNLPMDKKILLFSASGGIKNPQKGGKHLIEVFNFLKNQEDILFLNLGGDSGVKHSRWIDVPYIIDEKKLALYYSAADLFVYPSLVESFGLVAAESLACETPVITFNYSALPEIVDNEVGYLAEYKNSQDLIKGIKIFLNNKTLTKNAGIKGRKKIKENFTLDKMVNNYINLYSEILQNITKNNRDKL